MDVSNESKGADREGSPPKPAREDPVSGREQAEWTFQMWVKARASEMQENGLPFYCIRFVVFFFFITYCGH